MIRPGPSRLPPGLLPGGYIVHVYSVPDGRLMLADELRSVADVEASAVQHALTTTGSDVCLVFFDGDTGERVLPPGATSEDVIG